MALIRLDPDLRRVYVCGRRLHHGAVGVGLIVAGLILVVDDMADFPWSFIPD